mmetsp:Transcript_6246/g.9426  ORF Transcript_6246/g.9426 Transcript_6246/m.9426 type:complete len:150 (+) Transcript_6246:58-507(+)
MEDTASCHWCGKTEISLQQCAKCQITTYCSRDCQRYDWLSVHKKICRSPVLSTPPRVDVYYGHTDTKTEYEEYAAVILRTREDQIDYVNDIHSPCRNRVYEILHEISDSELASKYGADKITCCGWLQDIELKNRILREYGYPISNNDIS